MSERAVYTTVVSRVTDPYPIRGQLQVLDLAHAFKPFYL